LTKYVKLLGKRIENRIIAYIWNIDKDNNMYKKLKLILLEVMHDNSITSIDCFTIWVDESLSHFWGIIVNLLNIL